MSVLSGVKSYSSSHSFLPLPTSPRLTSLPPSPESERLGVGRLFRCQCLSRRSISEKVPYQNEKLLYGCKVLSHHLRSPSPRQIIRCFQVFYQAHLGLDHGVGHFRPLSITRQRHLLAYHGIAMRREDLCQVF